MGAPNLAGLKVVEISAFIAAPLGGMALGQLGADVVRIDQTGGGLDLQRWPVTESGESLYWQGLNKAKRSVFLDLRTLEGQRLAQDLIVDAGIVLTNRPAQGWLSYQELRRRRPDLIMLSIRGTHDNRTAVDYTVQARTGLPFITGAGESDVPVNHPLPLWDSLCGMTAAFGLLAAEHRRRETGAGQLVELSLEDVALWLIGSLGYIAEIEVLDRERRAIGNDVYGAFGRDFATADGKRVMVTVVTARQWTGLCAATELGEAFRHLEKALRGDFTTDADRWRCRGAIAALLEPWFAGRTLDEVREVFDANRVLWGPYQTLRELVASDPACSEANPMFARVRHPGVGTYLTPGSPLQFAEAGPTAVRPSPTPGADTCAVLAERLGLSSDALEALLPKGAVERKALA
ncbi:CoA transferase [Algihabitans albus]|uniref:CoA transferase n=1 Tax=Algihabitans albus TaxID=2164067 RepID=UPI000E5D88C6|nr:CoA transferase [Algihabitans albus]